MYSCWNQKTELTPDRNNLVSFRNADGDTLLFCHAGAGVVLTEYGLLSFRKGSYINIPKSIHHTFVFSENTQFIIVESLSSFYREPDRGMVGRNAFYDPASLGKPDLDKMHQFKKDNRIESLEIFVKRLEAVTQFSYSACVFDTVGWKGDYFPFTLHTDDMMPMISHHVCICHLQHTPHLWRIILWFVHFCHDLLKRMKTHLKFRSFTRISTTMKFCSITTETSSAAITCTPIWWPCTRRASRTDRIRKLLPTKARKSLRTKLPLWWIPWSRWPSTPALPRLKWTTIGNRGWKNSLNLIKTRPH